MHGLGMGLHAAAAMESMDLSKRHHEMRQEYCNDFVRWGS